MPNIAIIQTAVMLVAAEMLCDGRRRSLKNKNNTEEILYKAYCIFYHGV